jgi:hypothetical protein
MKWERAKRHAAGRLVAIVGLATALLATLAGHVAADPNQADANSRLVGTWTLAVTLRNCDTNAAMGAPFSSLATINSDGTSIGSTASLAFAPGQRSAEHGVWSHLGGRKYSETIVALISFDTAPNLPGSADFDPALPISPGLTTGWQTITHTITLRDSGHYTAAGVTQFYAADGTLYRSGCSSSVADRFGSSTR